MNFYTIERDIPIPKANGGARRFIPNFERLYKSLQPGESTLCPSHNDGMRLKIYLMIRGWKVVYHKQGQFVRLWRER